MKISRRSAILAAGLSLASPAVAKPPRRGRTTTDGVETSLHALERVIAEVMKKTGVPGLSVAVVSDDRVVFLKGFGVRRAGGADPVDADTVFALASLSKPIATTVVAGLVGDGVVAWDDKIIRHLPEFALSDPWITRNVTLRDMFCHRSGLPDHAGDLLEDMGYGREDVLRRLRYVKPTGNFRAQYAYTNFGFTAAAIAAARAAGMSWEDVSAERLYTPLGMSSASSRFSDFDARPNRAFGHVKAAGAWRVGKQRDPDAQSPAGGASASARDMAQWLRLQLGQGAFEGRDFIRQQALDETHVPHIVSAPSRNPIRDAPDFYGLGWGVNYGERPRVRWSHSGAFALGAATCVNILPAEKIGIVVLTNAAPVGAPEAICRSFLDLVTTEKIERDWLALFGEAFEKMSTPAYGRDADYSRPPPGAPPPGRLTDYVGSYRNELYGPIAVIETSGTLNLAIGPKNIPYVMTQFSGDTFVFQPAGENAGGPSPMRFSRNGEQKIVSVAIDYFNQDGQGVFERG